MIRSLSYVSLFSTLRLTVAIKIPPFARGFATVLVC